MQPQRLQTLIPPLLGVALGVVCLQVAYHTSPLVPIVMGGAVGASVLALWRPMWLLYGSILLIPMELFSLKIGGVGLSPAEAAFLLTGGGWAARRLLDGELPWSPSPVGIPLALLIAAALPGIAVTDEPFLVYKLVIVWTGLLLVYQMVVTDGDETVVRNLLFALAISGGIIGAIAIGGAAGNAPELVNATEAQGRAKGSFGHPNTLATYLALALPGALALGLMGRPSWRPVALVAFGAMLVGLSLSLSRGGLLAVAGALGVMLIWSPARRATLVAAAVAVALYAAGAQPLNQSPQVQTLTTRVESIGYSAEGVDPRFGIWERVPAMAIDSMPFGVGANNFSEVAARYGVLGPNGSPYEHAHNIIFTFTIELGLLGLIALILVAISLTMTLWRAYVAADTARRGLVLAIAAALVALTLQGMVDYTLRTNAVVAPIFVLAGAAVVISRSVQTAPEGDQRRASAA